jgi:cytosine deaminase
LSIALCGATVRGHEGQVDVVLEADRVAAVGPGAGADVRDRLDVRGHMVLPGFVDPHVHLDKALLRGVMRPNKSGTLQEAIDITNEFKRSYDQDEVTERAVAVLRAGVRNGLAVARVFVDVGGVGGLVPFRALDEARRVLKDVVDVQLVAFPQEGIVRDPAALGLLQEALEDGADVVGGLPWYEYTDEHARRHIDECFALAQRYDRPIHMLVDDTDDANSRTLEYLCVKTIEAGWQNRVAASHCGALAAYNPTYAAKIVDLVREAGVTVVSNPQISLISSGLRDLQPVRRGITRVRELVDAGVNVASGQDDVFDPYYPFGQPDPLEVAWMMCHAAHFHVPETIDLALDFVTDNAAAAVGVADYGVRPGALANLVVVQGESVNEVLRFRHPRRYVIRRGRVVVETETVRRVDL